MENTMKLKVELENGVRLLWPTPLFNKKFDETEAINKGLVRIIHEKERQDIGKKKSIIGGWHSSDDLHLWDFPEVKEILNFISTAITEITKTSAGVSDDKFSADMTYIAWANIIRNGGMHRMHSHPGSTWSGVYYVSSGIDGPVDDNNGQISFLDPRGAVEMIPTPGNPFGQPLNLPPEDGRIYCFPAWLKHMVYPYQGSQERITIGFNIRVENFNEFN